MTVRSAETWAFLRLDPDYRAARAIRPQCEDAPFPVRIHSQADLAAAARRRL